jgi:ergothioneine biosynthesis protein EgtB
MTRFQRTSMKRAGAPAAARELDLAGRFRAIRAATERLAEPLEVEDCVAQSMPDASPIAWHLAHTSWFFETFVLLSRAVGYRPFDPSFGYLFNSYYNAVGERVARAQRGLMTRPTLAEIRRYRAHVDDALSALLATRDAELPTDVITLGLNHEQQHQELMLTDLAHLFSLNPLKPVYLAGTPPPSRGTPLEFLRYDEGVREIGHAGAGFAFDNEGPRHRAFVAAFELASRPVTSGEWLAFIADRGYERAELWLSDGWDAVRRENWRAPLYWELDGDSWTQFTLGGTRAVDPHEPVCHVSYFEADAYARWADARLPTEAEWELAANACELDGNFVESGALHPRATRPADGAPAALFGDVWEWTQSAYAPYPGYRPVAGALGEYNGKFMCNQFVLRGGSCVSPRDHLRASYRNFFGPAARWQFSGLRLARDAR